MCRDTSRRHMSIFLQNEELWQAPSWSYDYATLQRRWFGMFLTLVAQYAIHLQLPTEPTCTYPWPPIACSQWLQLQKVWISGANDKRYWWIWDCNQRNNYTLPLIQFIQRLYNLFNVCQAWVTLKHCDTGLDRAEKMERKYANLLPIYFSDCKVENGFK